MYPSGNTRGRGCHGCGQNVSVNSFPLILVRVLQRNSVISSNQMATFLQRPRVSMKFIKTVMAVGLSILLSVGLVTPTWAARVYNFDTSMWEEQSEVQTRNRRGSAIKKQVVDYETRHKPGTLVIETGERRLYL